MTLAISLGWPVAPILEASHGWVKRERLEWQIRRDQKRLAEIEARFAGS
jgi:hypothetical protein